VFRGSNRNAKAEDAAKLHVSALETAGWTPDFERARPNSGQPYLASAEKVSGLTGWIVGPPPPTPTAALKCGCFDDFGFPGQLHR
jgi:hypothetical protein